jgi:ATP-dependent Lon protease
MTETRQDLPIVDLSQGVLFPRGRQSLTVSSDRLMATIESAKRGAMPVLVVARRRPGGQEPREEDLHRVGTVATVVEARSSGGVLSCVVEGVYRGRIESAFPGATSLVGRVEPWPDVASDAESVRLRGAVLRRTARSVFPLVCSEIPLAQLRQLLAIPEPGHLADIILANLPVDTATRQAGLEERTVERRLVFVSTLLDRLHAESWDVPRSVAAALRRRLRLLAWTLLYR